MLRCFIDCNKSWLPKSVLWILQLQRKYDSGKKSRWSCCLGSI